MILAGGRSSRMGSDKALMTVAGKPLLDRTCQVALACTDGVYVVTGWGDRYQPLVPDAVNFIEESTVSEMPPGPLVAIVQALTGLQTKADWVLVLACDLPNLSATTLQTWRDQLAGVEASCVAYLPWHQGRWEPLCGFYRVAALDDLRQYAETGGRSLQKWLHQRPVAAIPAVDEQMLVNVNTPADWAAWETAKDLDYHRNSL